MNDTVKLDNAMEYHTLKRKNEFESHLNTCRSCKYNVDFLRNNYDPNEPEKPFQKRIRWRVLKCSNKFVYSTVKLIKLNTEKVTDDTLRKLRRKAHLQTCERCMYDYQFWWKHRDRNEPDEPQEKRMVLRVIACNNYAYHRGRDGDGRIKLQESLERIAEDGEIVKIWNRPKAEVNSQNLKRAINEIMNKK